MGRFQFNTHTVGEGKAVSVNTRDLFPALKNGKERYRTFGFKEVALLLGSVYRSYRQTADYLNRFRHQKKGGTPSRTLRENTAEEGGKVLDFMEGKATQILQTEGFSPQCRPSGGTVEQEQGRRIETQSAKDIAQALDEVKAAGARQEVVVQEMNAVMEDPAETVNVSIDGVVVKSQKAGRGRPRENDEPKRIEDTVAHVEHGKRIYALVGRSVQEVFRLVLALVANSGLLTRNLVFFVDGQRSLQNGIQAFFGWKGNILIILDWFHLKKKCKELLSMALKGSKIRNVVLKRLCAFLWYGQLEQAVSYLKGLGDTEVRDYEMIENLIGYFARNKKNIPNYALREALGLRNSSNRGEKANDQIVSIRQKHKGMSWSQYGSITQAVLKTVVINKETKNWLINGDITLKLAS